MANLLDRSSLVLTPTAYNNGEALCIKPDDASGDFQFSRNSAATRVNAQGLVENVQILSSNLVQNGSFSEEGVQEVSNGSFSQEGSEELANSDFTNGLTSWNGGTGNTVVNNQLIANSSGLFYQSLNLTANKTYKAVINIESISQGGVNFYCQGNQSATITTSGVHTIYIVSGSSNSLVGINPQGTFEAVVNSISFSEVGQNWTLGTGWSIGEDKAICDGTNSPIDQYSVTTIGKTYKVDITVADMTTASINIRLGTSSSDIIGSISANGTYTFYGTVASSTTFRIRSSDGFDGSITNISVKEVGQNWVLGTGWDVSVGSANKTGSANSELYQTGVGIQTGKKYKFTYEITSYTSGGIQARLFSSTSTSGAFGVVRTAVGVYEEILTGVLSNGNAGFVTLAGFNGTISNINVIQITDDTNLPRINYEGFSYQDALGSELVLNGNWYSHRGADFTINNNLIYIENVGNTYGGIEQSFVVTANKIFKLKYNVTQGTTSTDWKVDIGSTQGASDLYSKGQVSDFTENTTITSNSNQIWIRIYNNTPTIGDNFSIDNVSVKEYFGQEVVPDSGCGSWLFEPQSTNLREQSDTFVGDTKIRGTINNDATEMSPSGLLGVEYLTATAANGLVLDASTATTGDGTFSVYLKRKTGVGDIRMSINGGVSNTTMAVDDTWKRFSLSTTTGLGQLVISCLTSGDEVYIWGWQEEALSYPTSMIPTEGSTVTRNQDVCTNGATGTGLINSTEGVLYAEIARSEEENLYRLLGIDDGTSNNYVKMGFENSRGAFWIRAVINGVTSISSDNALTSNPNEFYKIAIRYQSGNSAIYINGTSVLTTTTTFSSGNFTALDFNHWNNSLNFFGKTKALAVWKEALSDEELTELTTI